MVLSDKPKVRYNKKPLGQREPLELRGGSQNRQWYTRTYKPSWNSFKYLCNVTLLGLSAKWSNQLLEISLEAANSSDLVIQYDFFIPFGEKISDFKFCFLVSTPHIQNSISLLMLHFSLKKALRKHNIQEFRVSSEIHWSQTWVGFYTGLELPLDNKHRKEHNPSIFGGDWSTRSKLWDFLGTF